MGSLLLNKFYFRMKLISKLFIKIRQCEQPFAQRARKVNQGCERVNGGTESRFCLKVSPAAQKITKVL